MRHLLLFIGILLAGMAAPALAAEGMAEPWQLNFQKPATPVMEQLTGLHNYLLVIITAITVFVLSLLTYVCIRFRRSANPNPSKNAHNTTIEIIWTVVPVMILVTIAIPSFRIHFD